ncbi:MAG: cyclic nucleotide-binding domain-containing protein [Cyanobacteria bacterium P01_A01_bin.17]
MVSQGVENPIGLPTFGRLTQLLLLAVTVLVYCVLGIVIANSLFVSYVGASHLPIAFICIGLCSMPAYVLFSQVADRYSRLKLFRYVLLLSMVLAVGLRFLLSQEAKVEYYVLLVFSFFQWDFHNNVLYPSLLTDFFTTLEYKRYAPYVGMAQAVGSLLAGGLATVLAQYFRTRDLLLCLPMLFAIAFAQLLYLEYSQRPVNVQKSEAEAGIIESLKAFPDVVKRYPLALYLAGSSFLLVIIYLSSEFLWFSIYGQNFTDQELTGFLGLMRILISFVQVAVIYGFTRPLLQSVGVACMNIVYPLTTLGSFLGLIFNINVPGAVGLHLNGDALYKAINIPVHQLNYNAIPKEFIGRIRTLSDGVIYSLGLTLAGGMLWIAHNALALNQIIYLVMGLTVLLLLVRLPMGRFYAEGLEKMIRSSAINLDDFNEAQVQLPPQSSAAIRELLLQADRYTQIKGLELAANIGQPSQFLPEVQALLTASNPSTESDLRLRNAAVQLFRHDPGIIPYCEDLLRGDQLNLQVFALEVLLLHQYPFAPSSLQKWLNRSESELKASAALAAIQTQHVKDPQIAAVVNQLWHTDLPESTAKMITRVVAQSGNRAFVPVITSILPQANLEITCEGLQALTSLAQPGDSDLADVAQEKLEDPDAAVRYAAVDLLAQTRCADRIQNVASGLGDLDPRVRQRSAVALAAYGRPGLELAKERLSSPNNDVVNAAIATIGQVRTKQASNLLFEYLTPDFKQLTHTYRWQQQIPQNDPGWAPLGVAIADYHQRLIQKILYILACLGHSRTVNSVNRLLATTEPGDLANAIEVLASLRHRRFVLPLMPLLEQIVNPMETGSQTEVTPQWLRTKGYKLLLEALETRDRWIKTGALIALSMVPSALINDPDPFVQSVAQQIFTPNVQAASPTQTSMNRLLLLKNVAIFKNLSLDELLLIDEALEQEQVLAGTPIFAEGDWGSHLYILAEGAVKIVKTIDDSLEQIDLITSGQYFGEIALFDNAPRWNGAIATESSTLLKLEKTRFLSLTTQRPHIILEICRFLSQRLRETDSYRSTRKSSRLPEQPIPAQDAAMPS